MGWIKVSCYCSIEQLLNLLYVMVLQYGLVIYPLNLGHDFKMWLERAGKIIGMLPLTSLQEIFERSVKNQSLKITGDPSHILHKEYELMPSGRRCRVPICKLNRYKFSLIPLPLQLLNNNK